MMKPRQIMEYLGINKKFIPNEKPKVGESNQIEMGKISPKSDRRTVPYIDAIKEIEKIETHQCPEDMIGCLSASFERLKTAVVDQHKGKLELSTMDDVLPLSIYVVSMANLERPMSHKAFMEDYLRCN